MINALTRRLMRPFPLLSARSPSNRRPSLLSIAACAIATALVLGGCSSRFFSPYQMEIQQGNYITEREVALLREGMTRDQVRFVLGTPLVNDVFRNDRWDYVYTKQPQNSNQVELRRITVYFADDLAKRFEDIGVRDDPEKVGKR